MVSELVKGVIIGGVLGILGPFFTSTIGSWINDRRKKEQRVKEIAIMLNAEMECISNELQKNISAAKSSIKKMKKGSLV